MYWGADLKLKRQEESLKKSNKYKKCEPVPNYLLIFILVVEFVFCNWGVAAQQMNETPVLYTDKMNINGQAAAKVFSPYSVNESVKVIHRRTTARVIIGVFFAFMLSFLSNKFFYVQVHSKRIPSAFANDQKWVRLLFFLYQWIKNGSTCYFFFLSVNKRKCFFWKQHKNRRRTHFFK